MNFTDIRWGMIGAGRVAERKSAPSFNRIPHSRLAFVMQRDAARAEDYARRHGVERWTTSADELIAGCDAVYVATPPSTHAAYAIRAMRAGRPVYVEKPMARTHAECLEMLAMSRATRMPLFVAYYRRALPAWQKLRDLLREGEIGRVRSVRIELSRQAREGEGWRVDPAIAGAGLFYDLASHQFDILDFLLGPVAAIEGRAENRARLYRAEDTVTARFTFAGGIAGSGRWSFAAAGAGADTFAVTGDRGRISLPFFRPGPVLLPTRTLRFDDPDPVQLPLIRRVVAALRGEGECPSTGLSAARTSRILEQGVGGYYPIGDGPGDVLHK